MLAAAPAHAATDTSWYATGKSTTVTAAFLCHESPWVATSVSRIVSVSTATGTAASFSAATATFVGATIVLPLPLPPPAPAPPDRCLRRRQHHLRCLHCQQFLRSALQYRERHQRA